LKLEIENIQAAIEGILFAAGRIVTAEELSEILEIDKKTVHSIALKLKDNLDNNRGIQLREISGGYQLCTRQIHYDYISKLFETRQKQTLSQAALETASIIAYKQPITRVELEKIRGVNSDSAINTLVERNLIEEVGRMDVPGKPVLYGVTEEFLRVFGLKTVNDLPPIEGFVENSEIE
jgi:segregation and condensation protein B